MFKFQNLHEHIPICLPAGIRNRHKERNLPHESDIENLEVDMKYSYGKCCYMKYGYERYKQPGFIMILYLNNIFRIYCHHTSISFTPWTVEVLSV